MGTGDSSGPEARLSLLDATTIATIHRSSRSSSLIPKTVEHLSPRPLDERSFRWCVLCVGDHVVVQVGAYIAADAKEKEEKRIQAAWKVSSSRRLSSNRPGRVIGHGGDDYTISTVTFPRPPRPIETETHLPSSSRLTRGRTCKDHSVKELGGF